MKKLMSVVLGLSLLTPLASFAQKKPAQKEEKVRKGKKKGTGKSKKGTSDKTTSAPQK